MDPNADDAVEFHELDSAFVRALQTGEADRMEEEVGLLFRELEREMKRKQLRIVDLVHSLDLDGDGTVSTLELERG